MLTRRTVLSLLATLLIVAIAVWRAPIDWRSSWNDIRHADLRLYLLGVVAYYCAFAVRALRW